MKVIMKKSISALLIIVMLLSVMFVPVIADTHIPADISVSLANGSDVAIRTVTEQGSMTTLTIINYDNPSQVVYLDQETADSSGSVVFTAALKQGNYCLYTVGGQRRADSRLTVFDKSSALLEGRFTSGQYATLSVYDHENNIEHIDQQSISSGAWSFNITLPKGVYTAYIVSDTGEAVKIYIAVRANEGGIEGCTLSPVSGTSNAKYDTELSLSFDYPVELASDKSSQLILKGKKIYGGAEETKVFNNIMRVTDSDKGASTKVIIDLSKAVPTDRLDVNREYTLKIKSGSILRADRSESIDTDKLSWQFDTKWLGNKPGFTSPSGGTLNPTELRNVNGFVGLWDNQKYEMNITGNYSFKDNHYPIKWSSSPSDIGSIDRNGIVTPVSGVLGKLGIGWEIEDKQDVAPNYVSSGSGSIEIRPRPELSLKAVAVSDVVLGGKSTISKSGNIYAHIGRKLYAVDESMNAIESFIYNLRNTGTGSTSSYTDDLGGTVTIDGTDYVCIDSTKVDTKIREYTLLLDSQTGAVYRNDLPRLYAQLGGDSSIFAVLDTEGKGDIFLYDVEKEQYVGNTKGYSSMSYKSAISIDATEKYVYVGGANGNFAVLDAECNLIAKIQIGNSSVTPYATENGFVYAIGRDGKISKFTERGELIWQSSNYMFADAYSAMETGSGFYISASKSSERTSDILVRLNPSNGEETEFWGINANVLGEYEGFVYTDKYIIDASTGKIVGYTDLYGLPVTNGENIRDGYIYRIGDKGVEKCVLLPSYTPMAQSVRINDTYVRENTTNVVSTVVLDQEGFPMNAELEYQIDSNPVAVINNEGVISVGSLEDDDIDAEESYRVTAAVAGTDIKAEADIIVRKAPVVSGLKIISNTTGEEIEEIQTTVGMSGAVFNTYIEDQYGDFVKLQSVSYEVTEGETDVVSYLLYDGDSGEYQYKYRCTVSGQKPGEVVISAYLTNYPHIKDSIKVKVTEKNYEILWRSGTSGWGANSYYHDDGIYHDFVYTDNYKLGSIDKADGSQNWSLNIGHTEGIYPSAPYVDSEGIIFLYDIYGETLTAVDSIDGRVIWTKSYGYGQIVAIDVETDYLYALSNNGTLRCVDKSKGSVLWQSDIGLGKKIFTMASRTDNMLYISSGDAIYLFDSDGTKQTLVTYKGNEYVKIRDVSVSSRLVYEYTDASNKKWAVSLSESGSEQWRTAVSNEVTVAFEGENVYLLHMESLGYNKTYKLMALDKDGKNIFEPVIASTNYERLTLDSSLISKRPTVKNGIVYIWLSECRLFDSKTGEKLSEFYIKDTFFNTFPYRMTVDDDGVMYITSDNMGMYACTVKGQGGKDFSMSLRGRPTLFAGGLSEVSIDLFNYTNENMNNLMLHMTLIDTDTDKKLSDAFVFCDISAFGSSSFTFMTAVPANGKYKIIISAFSENEEAANPIELIVEGR